MVNNSRRLERQTADLAASRVLASAGSRMPTSRAMIAMHTSSSISVKPGRRMEGDATVGPEGRVGGAMRNAFNRGLADCGVRGNSEPGCGSAVRKRGRERGCGGGERQGRVLDRLAGVAEPAHA